MMKTPDRETVLAERLRRQGLAEPRARLAPPSSRQGCRSARARYPTTCPSIPDPTRLRHPTGARCGLRAKVPLSSERFLTLFQWDFSR